MNDGLFPASCGWSVPVVIGASEKQGWTILVKQIYRFEATRWREIEPLLLRCTTKKGPTTRKSKTREHHRVSAMLTFSELVGGAKRWGTLPAARSNEEARYELASTECIRKMPSGIWDCERNCFQNRKKEWKKANIYLPPAALAGQKTQGHRLALD